MAFWNSLEFLQKTNSTLVIGWVVISAVFGLLTWKVQSRISELGVVNETALKSQVETTQTKATELEDRLAQSEKLRAETDEKLKKEIEETNKKIAPRIITSEEYHEGVEVLSKLNSRQFVIKVMSEDFEGQDFAPALAKMLVDSGWEYSGTQKHGSWRFDDGIKIQVQSKTKEIEALHRLLNKYNFNPQVEVSLENDSVFLFIGKLPK
jgi:hypothetical protein